MLQAWSVFDPLPHIIVDKRQPGEESGASGNGSGVVEYTEQSIKSCHDLSRDVTLVESDHQCR